MPPFRRLQHLAHTGEANPKLIGMPCRDTPYSFEYHGVSGPALFNDDSKYEKAAFKAAFLALVMKSG